MKYLFAGIIVPAAVIIPIAAAILKKSYQELTLRIILHYLLFSGLINIAERILGNNKINNLPLLHLYTIGENLVILYFFYLVFKRQTFLKKVISVLMATFTLFALTNMFVIQGIYQYNSYSRPISSLIIIGLCMCYFLSQTTVDQQQSWFQNPLNWIITGLLIYFGSSLFHFAFLNVISERANLRYYFLMGNIHAGLVLVMYLLFTMGFINGKRR